MKKFKIVKESKALPEGWVVGDEVSYVHVVGTRYAYFVKSKLPEIVQPHFNALLELGVVEEIKECSGIESVTLNGVEIQQNGIIRNSRGRFLGRLDGVEYESEHVQHG